MTDIFRIETDKTYLNWSGKASIETPSDSFLPFGRLAVFPKRVQSLEDVKTWRNVSPVLPRDTNVQIGPRLYEETSYTLFLRGAEGDQVELRHRDPTILKGLTTSDDGRIVHGTINFRSQIGRSRFTVLVAGKSEYEFEIEVFPSKLDYASDYDALLVDVQDILTALVLEYLKSTFKVGLTTPSATSTKLEWIMLLRHLIDDLERGLRYIERHPHHSLTRERLPTRVERVRRPDATIFKNIVQGKGTGPRSKMASGHVVRTKLPERRARVTLDTSEHRWLASQLSRIRRRLAEIHLLEQKRVTGKWEQTLRRSRALEEIATLENRIAVLQGLEPIAQAEGLAPPGFTSLTLQASPGYREAFRACLMLNLGLRVNGGPVGLSIKDIHLLYEYWCYLTLVRLLAKITGERLPASRLFSVEQNGLRVELKRGQRQTVVFSGKGNRILELTYNHSFSGGAFIHAQKPDVVLTFRDPEWPTMRLVLDAKYRIETNPEYVTQFGSPGPPVDSINALHRYRDAILEQTNSEGPRSETMKRSVVEGVALFPFADSLDQFSKSHLWSSLERLGIGAIPLLPNETRYVEEWLRAVLQRGGWSTAERSIPYLSHEVLRTWRQAAKEAVLIGVLRPNAKEHLEWIKRERRYYAPLTPHQSRQLVSRWVAIYSPALLRSRGAVTHVASVEQIEVTPRSKIETPWASMWGPDQLHVVYQLGNLLELDKPIENSGPPGLGERFSNNRWTSRLGLLRATVLRELLLETEPEWRLYEQLRVAGVEFNLNPGPAKLQDEDDPIGRTWFVTERLQVQYRGSAGFLVKTDTLPDEYYADLTKTLSRIVSVEA